VLDGDEWSASYPSPFTPEERAPGTPWIGGCRGPSASLDTMAKRKSPSLPLPEIGPSHLACSLASVPLLLLFCMEEKV